MIVGFAGKRPDYREEGSYVEILPVMQCITERG